MVQVLATEVRRRGVSGHLVKWTFILFNVLMILWVVAAATTTGEVVSLAGGGAEDAGTGVGGTIGVPVVASMWIVGAVILGVLALLTRGRAILAGEQGRVRVNAVNTVAPALRPVRRRIADPYEEEFEDAIFVAPPEPILRPFPIIRPR